jgi:hypothetical protein
LLSPSGSISVPIYSKPIMFAKDLLFVSWSLCGYAFWFIQVKFKPVNMLYP